MKNKRNRNGGKQKLRGKFFHRDSSRDPPKPQRERNDIGKQDNKQHKQTRASPDVSNTAKGESYRANALKAPKEASQPKSQISEVCKKAVKHCASRHMHTIRHFSAMSLFVP